MECQGSFIRKNVFEFDWNEFPDEALQYDMWILSFDDEEEAFAEPEQYREFKQVSEQDSLG